MHRDYFTPTYSYWLNQVECWFSKLQRNVIDRGIFTSVADLKRKILRYIRLYHKTAKPFQWKYDSVSRAPIDKSPYVVMAYASRVTYSDIFQKGDPIVFFRVLDDHYLAMPDRPCNKGSIQFQTFPKTRTW